MTVAASFYPRRPRCQFLSHWPRGKFYPHWSRSTSRTTPIAGTRRSAEPVISNVATAQLSAVHFFCAFGSVTVAELPSDTRRLSAPVLATGDTRGASDSLGRSDGSHYCASLAPRVPARPGSSFSICQSEDGTLPRLRGSLPPPREDLRSAAQRVGRASPMADRVSRSVSGSRSAARARGAGAGCATSLAPPCAAA